jgi:dihydrofolate reductase
VFVGRRLVGKLTAFEWVSLDGVYDAESMHQWFFPYDSLERRKFILGTYEQSDGLLIGRATYEMLAPYWSSLADEDQDGLAGVLRRKPKYVATNEHFPWNWGTTTFFSGDTPSEVEKLRGRVPNLLLIGSRTLARDLAASGLIDEYKLLVQPFIMGTGERFFDETIPTPLRLLGVQELDQGMLLVHYAVEKSNEA